METLTDEEIEDNILLLNLTPRKVLGGLTPLEALLAGVLRLLLDSSVDGNKKMIYFEIC